MIYIEYLFNNNYDNAVYELTYEHIEKMIRDNNLEEAEGKAITNSSYHGANFYNGQDDRETMYKEHLYRDPKTAGYRMYYPHGIVIEQSMKRNYYRGENRIYPESVPTLLRNIKNYSTIKEKELYRMVSDMRIAEFKALLEKFEHVRNWHYSDVLYEVLAQHYGLETSWLDITNDFNVALFFATCYWRDGSWHPLTQEMIDTTHSYGMIFHMPTYIMSLKWINALEDFSLGSDTVVSVYDKEDGSLVQKKLPNICRESNIIYPLGFQPFMRCHMQSGYGIYMRNPVPLQNNCEFQKLKFKQSVELSQRVFDMMDGGKKIYPHEGLEKVEFIIDKIRKLTQFSVDSFEYALYRNHYYRIEDREKCLDELHNFSVNGEYIKIVDQHPWKLSSGRRKKIDRIYKDFSIEKDYGIMIRERKEIPGPSPMYEPWMLRSAEDEPGTIDFKLRAEVNCESSVVSRSLSGLLYMIEKLNLSDF